MRRGSIQLQVHPDRGGDTTLAARINASYSAIQQNPTTIEMWIKQMHDGNGASEECLAIIEGLTAKVEELEKVERDYRTLQDKYVQVLASRTGSGEKAEVRKAAPRTAEREIFEEEPDDRASREPEVKRPRARRVDAAETRAGEKMASKRETPSRVKPIVLENLVLYGMGGKPAHRYERIEFDGEAVRGSDGEYLIKSQNDWNEYFSRLGDGRRLPSLPEVYVIMERLHETKHPALAGIVRDLTESWLCTGTKNDYLDSTIIHPGYGTIECPLPLGDHWLDEVVENKPLENALQALLMCKDAKKAVKVLREVSGERPYIWTPSAEGRKSRPERAVWLNASTDGLYLYCGNIPINSLGRARGVRVVSAAGAREK